MTDPAPNALEALQAHAKLCIAYRDHVAAMVNELAGAVASGDVKDPELLRHEVGLLERAQDRITRTLMALARLSVRDRLARLEEAGQDVRHLWRLFENLGDDG